MKLKKIFGVMLLLSVVVLAGCNNTAKEINSHPESTSSSSTKSYEERVKETQAKILKDAPSTYEGEPATDEMKDAYITLNADYNSEMTRDEAMQLLSSKTYKMKPYSGYAIDYALNAFFP